MDKDFSRGRIRQYCANSDGFADAEDMGEEFRIKLESKVTDDRQKETSKSRKVSELHLKMYFLIDQKMHLCL